MISEKIRYFYFGIIAQMRIVILLVWVGLIYIDMCELHITRRFAIYARDTRRSLRMSMNFLRTRSWKDI